MRRCAEALLALALGAVPAGAAHGGDAPRLDEREAMRISQAVIGTVPPDFTLLDRNERPVRLSELRGKPLLVSFIYTGCFTACPAQTLLLREALAGLDPLLGRDQYNVVSIGFNQPFDSPLALRLFADKLDVEHPSWKFLSPHLRQVPELTRAYGFSYVRTPHGFDHSVSVTVLDAQGRIRGHVYGDTVTAASLGVALRELLLSAFSAGGTRLPSLGEVIERVRILCTVYDARTGEYRFDWTLLIMLTGGLTFFLVMAVYLLREWIGQRRARRAPRREAAHARTGAASRAAH